MKLNEQSSNWTNTDKIDYLNKKSNSDNFETQIVKKDGEDVYQYRKKTQSSTSTSSSTPRKKLGTIIKFTDPKVSDIHFKYKYPGDNNWDYGVKNGEWYAKNKRNQNVFNISIVPEFKGSVENLNKKFPDALKSENNKEPEKETNVDTTKPNVQVRPKETQFNKMKQDANKLSKDIEFKPKYLTTTKDSIGSNEKVLNKQEEPTIYNIDSNKEEL
jgi:hypothetical protein